jgi:hypothetical protein
VVGWLVDGTKWSDYWEVFPTADDSFCDAVKRAPRKGVMNDNVDLYTKKKMTKGSSNCTYISLGSIHWRRATAMHRYEGLTSRNQHDAGGTFGRIDTCAAQAYQIRQKCMSFSTKEVERNWIDGRIGYLGWGKLVTFQL